MKGFFEYGFLVRALTAGFCLAVLCGVLSPVIVLRRMAFAADGLAHASLGGLALSLLFLPVAALPGLANYLVSFIFTCLVALAIGYFARRVQSDTAVGACYVAGFALGVTLLALRQHGLGRLEHLFFGSILAVQPLELGLLAGLTGSVLTACGLGWRWLGAWTFDEEIARAEGVPVAVLRYALMLLIAATVIVATRIVGILLVAALMVLPGATGCLVARHMGVILAISTAAAVLSATAGMAISSATNVPPGPTIVLAAFGCFLAAFCASRWRDRRAARPAPGLPNT
ncbi:MAG: metal ABC transporter permease [Verrucomicrobiae bacterium]|nr:metal ABC transporter permease [Verrucomicrobiae bacterium]